MYVTKTLFCFVLTITLHTFVQDRQFFPQIDTACSSSLSALHAALRVLGEQEPAESRRKGKTEELEGKGYGIGKRSKERDFQSS